MQQSMKIQLWIYLWMLIGYRTIAVAFEYDIGESDREISYDFDTEQSEVRYDPKLLSEELEDTLSKQSGAACNISNVLYKHGEQVARNDPCEVCVCMDGEIFCYWRQCNDADDDDITTIVNQSGGVQDDEQEEKETASQEVDDKDDYFRKHWKKFRSQIRPIKRPKSSKPIKKPLRFWKKRKSLKADESLPPYLDDDDDAADVPSQPRPTFPPVLSTSSTTKLPKIKKVWKNMKRPTKWPRKPTRKRYKSKKIFSFPEHLPATLHIDFDAETNNRNTDYHQKSDAIEVATAGPPAAPILRVVVEGTGRANHAGITDGDVKKDIQTATVTTKAYIDLNDSKSQSFVAIPAATMPMTERILFQSPTNANDDLIDSTVVKSESAVVTPTSSSTTTTAAAVVSTTRNFDCFNKSGSSKIGLQHISFQSGGIIPSPEEDDADDNDDDGGDGENVHFDGGADSSDNNDKKNIDSKSTGSTTTDSIQNGHIQFVDVPLSKHYIITSSGSVENGDILASENVLSQFRTDYRIVGNGGADTIVGMTLPSSDVLDGGTADGSQTDGMVAERLQKNPSTSSNDAVKSSATSLSLSLPASLSSASTATVATGSVGFETVERAAALPLLPGLLPGSANGRTQSTSATVNPTYVAAGTIVSSDSSASSISPSLSLAASLPQIVAATSTSSTEQVSSSTPSRQQECIVMGTSYKIGDILPQETGNCLQCICAEGSNSDDTPRITCSPHNCPPLVLPDLFDTTGY